MSKYHVLIGTFFCLFLTFTPISAASAQENAPQDQDALKEQKQAAEQSFELIKSIDYDPVITVLIFFSGHAVSRFAAATFIYTHETEKFHLKLYKTSKDKWSSGLRR